MGTMISFKRPDGQSCRGYLASAGEDRPSVVVIQEWWGLNAQICGIADRLADAGFNALAPDLFYGRTTRDANEASHWMADLDFAQATHQDIRGAVDHLRGFGRKVGVSGYCMGGALAIAAAVHVPGLAAAVCFYGIPPKAFADPARIGIPFQGHFACRDDWCTPKAVDALERSMRASGATPEIYHYEADHAFCNEARPEVFDSACTALAWERALVFWREHLA